MVKVDFFFCLVGFFYPRIFEVCLSALWSFHQVLGRKLSSGGGPELIAAALLFWNLKAKKVGHVGRTHFPSSSVPAPYLENSRRSWSSVKFRKPAWSPLGAGEPPPQLPERSFRSTSKYVSTVGQEMLQGKKPIRFVSSRAERSAENLRSCVA